MTPHEATNFSAGEVAVLERLARLETKFDALHETREIAARALTIAERNEKEIVDLKIYAGENRSNANIAKTTAEAACEDITEIKDTIKWTHRTGIIACIGLGTGILVQIILQAIKF